MTDDTRDDSPIDERDEPCYVISVAARMVGLHAQTLRYYERKGLLSPSRSVGKIRFYSQRDVEHIKRIKSLMEDLGVNLAGVEVAMRLMERIQSMEHEMRALAEQLDRLNRPSAEGEIITIEPDEEEASPPVPEGEGRGRPRRRRRA